MRLYLDWAFGINDLKPADSRESWGHSVPPGVRALPLCRMPSLSSGDDCTESSLAGFLVPSLPWTNPVISCLLQIKKKWIKNRFTNRTVRNVRLEYSTPPVLSKAHTTSLHLSPQGQEQPDSLGAQMKDAETISSPQLLTCSQEVCLWSKNTQDATNLKFKRNKTLLMLMSFLESSQQHLRSAQKKIVGKKSWVTTLRLGYESHNLAQPKDDIYNKIRLFPVIQFR